MRTLWVLVVNNYHGVCDFGCALAIEKEDTLTYITFSREEDAGAIKHRLEQSGYKSSVAKFEIGFFSYAAMKVIKFFKDLFK